MTPAQTLDWLAEQHKSQCNEDRPVQTWIRSMKSMLPAPVQEPVAYRSRMRNRDGQVITGWVVHTNTSENPDPRIEIEPLYTTPPAAKPATEESSAVAAPASWMEMVTANLVREGVNKHKARELAEHFYSLAQRPFVGLTDEEMSEVYNQADWDTVNGWEYERAIEAKLRSKNT